mgnify:CR=1 FL=1
MAAHGPQLRRDVSSGRQPAAIRHRWPPTDRTPGRDFFTQVRRGHVENAIGEGRVKPMATISSPGVGSGLDVNSIVTSWSRSSASPLFNCRRRPLPCRPSCRPFGEAAVGPVGSCVTPPSALTQSEHVEPDQRQLSSDAASGGRDHRPPTTARQLQRAGDPSWRRHGRTSPRPTARPPIWSVSTITSNSAAGVRATASPPSPAPRRSTSRVGPPAKSLAEVRDMVNAANAGITATVLERCVGLATGVSAPAPPGAANGFRITRHRRRQQQRRHQRSVGAGLDPSVGRGDDVAGAGG